LLIRSVVSNLSADGKRTGFANFETKRVDETAVPNERHDPPSQVNDLSLGKVFAKLSEEVGPGLAMISGENLGVVDGCLFTDSEQGTLSVPGKLGDHFFR